MIDDPIPADKVVPSGAKSKPRQRRRAIHVPGRTARDEQLSAAQDFPNLAMVAGDQVNNVGDGTTAQAVITVTVATDLVA
jgi:hypothetical protein